MQEMAKGYEIRSMIYALGTIMAIVLIVGIFLLVKFGSNMTTKNICVPKIRYIFSVKVKLTNIITIPKIRGKKFTSFFQEIWHAVL